MAQVIVSPARSPAQAQAACPRRRLTVPDRLSTQGAEIGDLKKENARLQALVSELRTDSPSVARLTDLAVWREREAFGEKTRRALALLRKKDAKIRELGDVVARRRHVAGRSHSASAKGGERSERGESTGKSCTDTNNSHGDCTVRRAKGIIGDVNATAAPGVVKELEQCVREQDEQIEALVEEVARLRAGQHPIAQSPDVRKATASFKETDEEGNCPGECRRGRVWEDGTTNGQAVEDLRNQVAQLKFALSAQAAELTQKGAALDEVLKARQIENVEAHEREAALTAKVSTLEHLQETARSTILEREELLREANAKLSTHGKLYKDTGSNKNNADGAGGSSCVVDASTSTDRIVGGANIPLVSKDSNPEPAPAVRSHVTSSTPNDLREFLGAQEWWMSLAVAAEKQDDHASAPKPKTRDSVASTSALELIGAERKGTVERLRQLLRDQGLEVITLRQRMLQAEIAFREKMTEQTEREAAAQRRIMALDHALRTSKMEGSTRVGELEIEVAKLRARGDMHEALAAAHDEVTACKLDVVRAKGNANLHSQLFEEEKGRSAAALSRAEDLQGKLDRIAVADTLQGVPGGVTASCLIETFVGTALRQSQRVQALEDDIRNMRTRCTRLARLARGEPVDSADTDMTAGGETRRDGNGKEGQAERQTNDWEEATVQEAAVAMELGRRRALENEVESLKEELLSQRRRTEALQREMEDERQHGPRVGVALSSGRQHTEVETLRRELLRATSEIEALRAHADDLRNHFRSNNWRFNTSKETDGDAHDGTRDNDDAGAVGSFSDVGPGAGNTAAATALKTEISITNTLGETNSSCSNCARLESLLAEKSAQVGVLTATVGALQVPPTSALSSPRKFDGDPRRSGINLGRGRSASPRGGTGRGGKHAASGGHPFAAWDDCTDVDGGVAILSHIGAQGLVRHCVALATRLTATMRRAWANERRADRDAAAMERKERELSTTQAKLTDLSEKYRLLDLERSKMAAALKRMQTESAVRLREAGEEGSKLRRALRDAELGAVNAQQRLQLALDEGHALETELQKGRERHRDELTRLSDEHIARLNELANRLCGFESTSRSHGGTVEGEPGPSSASMLTASSPMAGAIAHLTEQWRSYVANQEKPSSRRPSSRSKSRKTDSDHADIRNRGERQRGVAAFLQETMVNLSNECSRAVRRARALEWELRGARQDARDQKTALDEARVERARLLARMTAAEAAVVASSHVVTMASSAGTVPVADVDNSFCRANSSSGGAVFAVASSDRGCAAGSREGGLGGHGPGSCTVAAFSLLEKRLQAAVEDLVTAEAARAAAEVGETAATERAAVTEVGAAGTRAAVDVLKAELERHKTMATEKVRADALEWRREIRVDIGRWWHDDLMSLHKGIALDWGSSGAADEAAAVGPTFSPEPSRSLPSHHENPRYFRSDEGVNLGVTGEEAMAQALIAGRAEQAIVEERLLAQEHYVARVRAEVLHLRSILERWHGEFVIPAMEARRRRPVATAATAASVDTTPKVPVIGGSNRVDAGALAATTELLRARDKVAGLQEEVTTLRALVGTVREDEREARETADRRVQSTRETMQRRADGDLRDANECLAEERERFKSQLGAAHADVLRLGAELAELERRNQQLERERSTEKIRGGFDESSEGSHRSRSKSSPSDALGWSDSRGSREERGQEPANGKADAIARERGLREAAEKEREALRRMCNGLAIDLKTAVDAKAEAEGERQAVVQEAAKAKAEALTARLAREVQEAALEKLGCLLEAARRGVTMPDAPTDCGDSGDQALRSTGPVECDRSKGEARQFTKIMIAAKVTEADLQRRLQAASASEAELRHKIRRLERRIEGLKGEQIKTTCSTGASTTPWSTLAGHRSTNSLESAVDCRGESAPGGGTRVTLDHERTLAKHAEKEISQAATIMQLELDLAEAAARGDVGEASASAASRLALRLLSEGEGSVCSLCSRPIPPPPPQQQQQQRQPQPRDTRDTQKAMRFSDSQQGRGASFLMPSVEIERKAAHAGQSKNAGDNKAQAQVQAPVTAAAPMTKHADAIADRLEVSGKHSDVEDVSNQRCRPNEQNSRRLREEGGLSTDGLDRSHAQSPRLAETDTTATQKRQRQNHQGLSHTVALLEAQLARIARDLGEDGGCVARKGLEKDGVGGDSHDVRSRSPVSHLSRSARASWTEAVRDLGGQVAELRDRALCTEEMLKKGNAIQQELRGEVQRLRAELLRQKRSYWQATAVLKDRYRRALAAGANGKHQPPTTAGTRIKRGQFPEKSEKGDKYEFVNAVGTNAQREVEQSSSQGVNPRGKATATEPSQAEVEVRSLRETLRNIEHRLAEKEQEIQNVRRIHVQEVERVKHEVKRAAEAQRARVETLESKAQRARVKVKAMARRKMGSVRHVKGRAAVRNGRGGSGSSTPSPTSVDAPFSVDELLNMLAAADEEAFEAKGRVQRAEYDLRVRAAETDALRRSISGISKGCNTATAPPATEAGDVGVCPTKRGNQERRSQSTHAGVDVGVFERVACTARLETAEAEVARLRDEGLAANEKILEAQREVSALRLAASRASAAKASDGRAREKELKKQVSRLKRETARLRNTAGGVLFQGAEGERANTCAEAAATEEAKSRAQLAAAREDSERRARTITALRAAKSSLEKQLEQSQKKLIVVEGRLNRSLKDVGVKDNALHTLRGKVSALEAEIETTKKMARPLSAAPAPAVDFTAESAHEGATTGGAVGGVDSRAPLEDCTGGNGHGFGGNNSQETIVRDLRAERDRLQTSMRARQGLLTKKTAELDTKTAELQRVEQQACSLRAAVARKDDAYRTTKKQLLSLREEYDLFRASSQRWQADAEIKWRNLKRASESAAREVRTSRKTGDAATRELIALKSAFRSFLKTLWDDLLSRPPGLIAAASAQRQNEQASDGGSVRRANAPSAVVGPSDNIAASHPGKVVVPTLTSRGIRNDIVGQVASLPSSAVVSATVVGGTGHSRGDMASPGQLEAGCGELTEAEVIDIMQALSVESPSPLSSIATPSAASMLRGSPAQHSVFPGSPVRASCPGDSTMVRPIMTPSTSSLSRATGFEEGDDEFSARVQLALGERDTSEALAKMLRSIRGSEKSWRGRDGGIASDELLVPPPPPQPQPPSPSVIAS